MKVMSMYLRSIRPKEGRQQAEDYALKIPALRHSNLEIEFSRPVTFLVGENGSGKSTLLEAIAIGSGFNPGGGSRNTLNTQRRSESNLHDHLRFTWNKKVFDGFFLRAESFFNFASFLEEWEKETGRDFHGPYGGKSLHEQSHGESFLALAKNRFTQGMFLLDEPEAALSPNRQLTFLSIIHQLVQAGKSQLIIATHSPILLSYPNAKILEFTSDGIHSVQYEDTDHFRITKDFLTNKDMYLEHLLKDQNRY